MREEPKVGYDSRWKRAKKMACSEVEEDQKIRTLEKKRGDIVLATIKGEGQRKTREKQNGMH